MSWLFDRQVYFQHVPRSSNGSPENPHAIDIDAMFDDAEDEILNAYWPSLEDCLPQRKRILGDDIDAIIRMYKRQECWDKVNEHLVAVIEKRKQLLGGAHHKTLDAMAELASSHMSRGHLKEAEQLLLKIMERMLPLSHDSSSLLNSMVDLAKLYKAQGRWDESEGLLNALLEQCKQQPGDYPNKRRWRWELATLYMAQGRLDEFKVICVDDEVDELETSLGKRRRSPESNEVVLKKSKHLSND